jgi:hypothetical protein
MDAYGAVAEGIEGDLVSVKEFGFLVGCLVGARVGKTVVGASVGTLVRGDLVMGAEVGDLVVGAVVTGAPVVGAVVNGAFVKRRRRPEEGALVVGAVVGNLVGAVVGPLVEGALVGPAVGVTGVFVVATGAMVTSGFDMDLLTKLVSTLLPLPQDSVAATNIILSRGVPVVSFKAMLVGLLL